MIGSVEIAEHMRNAIVLIEHVIHRPRSTLLDVQHINRIGEREQEIAYKWNVCSTSEVCLE